MEGSYAAELGKRAASLQKEAMEPAGLSGLLALGGVGAAGGYGAASAPQGHRAEGAYRGVSRFGHALGGAGVGGLAGGALAAQLAPESGLAGLAVGGLGGAALGGLAGDKAWQWTMPQPT